MRQKKAYKSFILGVLLAFVHIGGLEAATINLIIDDLGYAKSTDKKFIDLEYDNISYSFLPDAYFTPFLVKYAAEKGKNILIHMPLESSKKINQEKSILKVGMSKAQMHARLDYALRRIPNSVGLNGHQGSLFTADATSMKFLIEWLDQKGLYFIDSRTTKYTLAAKIAQDYGVPNISRQVFLDHEINEASIRKEWQRLLRIAKKHGNGVAIAHPHSVTLKVLREELPKLKEQKITIASLDTSIRNQSPKNWHKFYAKKTISTGAYTANKRLITQKTKTNRRENSLELSQLGNSFSTGSGPNISPNSDAYFFTTPYKLQKIVAQPLIYNTEVAEPKNINKNARGVANILEDKHFLENSKQTSSRTFEANEDKYDGLLIKRNFVEQGAQNKKFSKFPYSKKTYVEKKSINQLDTTSGIKRRIWTPQRKKVD